MHRGRRLRKCLWDSGRHGRRLIPVSESRNGCLSGWRWPTHGLGGKRRGRRLLRGYRKWRRCGRCCDCRNLKRCCRVRLGRRFEPEAFRRLWHLERRFGFPTLWNPCWLAWFWGPHIMRLIHHRERRILTRHCREGAGCRRYGRFRNHRKGRTLTRGRLVWKTFKDSSIRAHRGCGVGLGCQQGARSFAL